MSTRFNSYLISENFLENLSEKQKDKMFDILLEDVDFEFDFEDDVNEEEEIPKLRQIADQALKRLQNPEFTEPVSDSDYSFDGYQVLHAVAQVAGRPSLHGLDGIRLDFGEKSPLSRALFWDNDNSSLNLTEADLDGYFLFYLDTGSARRALNFIDQIEKTEDLIGEQYFGFWHVLEDLLLEKELKAEDLKKQNINLEEFITYFIKNPEHVAQIMEFKSAFKFLEQRGLSYFVGEIEVYLKDEQDSFYNYLYHIWMMEALYKDQNLLVFAS